MTPLQIKTYTLLKLVPAGYVTTYKSLAHALGTRAYRAIGQFMRSNPYSYEECNDPDLRIPCHRVVASNGSIGGFMGKTRGMAITKKIELLKQEGITVRNNTITHFASRCYTFTTSHIDNQIQKDL